MSAPLVNICIPTYNRATCLNKAIDSALGQTYENFVVTVIDDASTDSTYECVQRYFDLENFCYMRLRRNVGTAQAKNVAIMFSSYDAITFHDSDDVVDQNKILLQIRALCQKGHVADEILNWRSTGHVPGGSLQIDLVVSAHTLIQLDGRVHHIDKRISLVDDFFPNLQLPSKTQGDWILINSGLFRGGVFSELGGYLDSVEEDRELRNRLVSCGYLIYFLDASLLTKIETSASLTQSGSTGYNAERRRRDRQQVWDRVSLAGSATSIAGLKEQLGVEVDLRRVQVEMVSNPRLLTFNAQVPHTGGTEAAITGRR